MDEFGGVFPTLVDALRSLPGIGEYTAGAIACFAFEQDVAVSRHQHAPRARASLSRSGRDTGKTSGVSRSPAIWFPSMMVGGGTRR